MTELLLIFGETTFIEVPKIHKIRKICSLKKGTLWYILNAILECIELLTLYNVFQNTLNVLLESIYLILAHYACITLA